jgi:hypothetical protein
MPRKFFLIPLVLILLLCGACAEEKASSIQTPVSVASVSPAQIIVSAAEQPTATASPEIVGLMDDPYVLAVDFPRLINNSDIIVLARVEETLPAELEDNDYVVTPANIKVIRSLKGDYKPGDIFRIDQPGGVAGGIDFRPATMDLHENSETYLFFLSGVGILDSEHVANGQIKGYFLDGITIDKAVSIIGDCVKTGKLAIDKNDIKSFGFTQRTHVIDWTYTIDKTTLEAQLLSENGTLYKTAKWDTAKWDSLISDLEKCGVFKWKNDYGDAQGTYVPYWKVEIDYIGKIKYEGTNAYPHGWDSFMNIIDEYFGSLK